MSATDILGLLIGVAVLAAAAGYLVDVYRNDRRFRWLDLPRRDNQPFASVPSFRRKRQAQK
ncbi:MAG: hypothetical protein ACM31D_09105 [Bacteroidota bacterium]